ncbi:MAG: RNA methyltransferase [Planctomycetes bacterium]|nr:RNA methyltransferase [Planctomycetota bacterium]
MKTSPSIQRITSRDNPMVKRLRQLSGQSNVYRTHGQFWLEGDHLCRAALSRAQTVAQAFFSESFWEAQSEHWLECAPIITLMPEALFSSISGLESPSHMGFLMGLPEQKPIEPGVMTVVLDRLQDAGNVGSILRSAAAFGVRQVLALKGTAALWSPKVLRSGMGAHFGLQLIEGLSESDLDALVVPRIATSSHQGPFLHEWMQSSDCPYPCAWLLGHEGQGLSESLMQSAKHCVRIAQPGGEESLNVAAAAAICLHASASVHLGSQKNS